MIKMIFKVKDIENYGNGELFHKDFRTIYPGAIKGFVNKYHEDDEVEITLDQAFKYGLLDKGI